MKSEVSILFFERFSKKGYAKIVGRVDNPDGSSALAVCFAHRSAFPDIEPGEKVPSIVYRSGYELRFEPMCTYVSVPD